MAEDKPARAEGKPEFELPLTVRDTQGDLLNLSDAKMGSLFSDAPKGSTAIINISGPLVKNDYVYDDWYSSKRVLGMNSIGSIIMEADAAENISGIVLVVDSPGGTVDGTETFANRIKNTKTPIVVLVDGLAASAAYWASSQSNRVVLNGQTSMVGSIGTMIQLMNADGLWAKWGIKLHRITATKSEDKNRDYIEALDGKYELIRSNLLDPVNEVFLKAVRDGRKGAINLKTENVLTGKVYIGQEAVNVGLADEIGNMDTALAVLGTMAGMDAKDRKQALRSNAVENANDTDLVLVQSTDTNMKLKLLAAWPALASLFSLEAGKEHEIEMTANQAELINAQLAAGEAAEQRATAAEQQLTAIKAVHPDATDLVAAITTTKQERDTFAAGSSGGAQGAGGNKPADDFSGGKPKEKASWELEAEAKFKKA